MKKIRIFLAVAAVTVAGAGVFANSLTAIEYFYVPSTATIAACEAQFTGTPCQPGPNAKCPKTVGTANVVVTYRDLLAEPQIPCTFLTRTN